MQCPYCRELESRVVDSRVAGGGAAIWRRRECAACTRRYTTYERVEHVVPVVVKRDGQRQPFDRDKLARSLRVACSKRPVTPEALEAVVDRLELELAESGEREISTIRIGQRVMEHLKELDQVAYVRFASVYKSFRDVEDFLSEMGDLVRGKVSG